MGQAALSTVVETVRKSLQRLSGTAQDYDRLLELVGDARCVLLGEASHGTYEFYHERAEITKRLIREKGIQAVAVEADWPDAYRVNHYVRGAERAGAAIDALAGFIRFPTWMWRNIVVRDFVVWLRAYNDVLPADKKIGFYGLDLYSLHTSIEAVLRYLDKVDPAAARRARHRYSCFQHFGEDTQAYGYAATLGLAKSCEDEVVGELVELRRRAQEYASRDGRVAQDEYFFTEQNARLVRNAEAYYRTMFGGHVESWNLRDRHMTETLQNLLAYLSRGGSPAKVAVWAHNSHLGDARATQMGQAGELNVGQLVRQQYGRDAALVGFTTYSGTVTASSDWGARAERKIVRPALQESYEYLFHQVGVPRFLLSLRTDKSVYSALHEPRLERAIGVIYRPETERLSHYFQARLSEQFDAVIHLDQTHALEPLERTEHWEKGEEPPETYPSGI
jgi:erythromycin esterase-like protein